MEGKACHAQIVRAGLQADTITSNMLINLYSKCGLVIYARKIFDVMPERSIVSWNTMIGSYTQNKEEENGFNLFIKMQRDGTQSSEFTMSSVLCACAANCAIAECKQLHAFAVKIALDSNAFVATALVDVYAKCSLIKDAVQIFDRLHEKSVVMWSSMVSGFVQNELYEEALVLFREAQRLGVEQSQFILSSVICASASLAALIEGNQIHAMLHKTGFLSNIFVASSLIDMYSKCGMLEEAYTVFLDAEEKSIVLWNNFGKVELAEVAARHLFEIEPDNAGNHVLLSNIYAANKMWDKVIMARKVLKNAEVKRERGKSWIEVKGKLKVKSWFVRKNDDHGFQEGGESSTERKSND
ncbi:Pentatricopeptide repeat [Dillenia turbinata]|uniref:Pentatricopeptide repeat n=1 Tax=Dillenia turbinata TaxID=194707 RepID=A0AAN8VGM5_9MAGN